MKKLLLSFLAMYCFCNVFAQVQIAVMDADNNPSINGIYTENGTFGGRPRYVKGNMAIYIKNCRTQWEINDTNYSGCPDYATFEESSGNLPSFYAWHQYGSSGGGDDPIQLGLPGSLIPSHDYIGESINDDGSMNSHTAIIIRYFFPQGSTYTGSVGDNFVTSAKVNVYNIPAGLTPVITKLSDTTLRMTLTGNAANHTASDDEDSVRIELLDAAFSHGDTNLVANPNITGIRVVFDREYYYVSDAITFPQVNGWFMEDGTYNGQAKYRNGYYYMGYRNCSSRWVINQGYRGMQNGACPMYSTRLTGSTPPSKAWYYGRYNSNTEPIKVRKPNSINYSKNIFTETLANDGSINNDDTLVIQLCFPDGFTFTGTNGENFVTTSKVNVYNLPVGLTAVITRMNDTTLYATLEGNAISHTSSNNEDSLTLEFLNSAFTNNDTSVINNHIKADFKILFDPLYMYIDYATEYPSINGLFPEIGNYNGKKMYKKDDYYLGYRDCYTKWVINSGDENSIGTNDCPIYSTMADNDTIPPDEGWKYGGRNGNNSNILITPVNSIYYNRKVFIESDNNDGSFEDTIAIRYVYPLEGLLAGSNGENFVATAKIIVNNLPAGLSMGIYRTSDTSLIAVIEGTASNHDNVPDILNLAIDFQNTAFTHGNAGNVIFSSMPDLSILFLEKIAVEDAISNANVNGVYKKTGYINGRRLYSKGEYRLGYRGCNRRWVINGYDNDYSVARGVCPLYYTPADSILPYYNDGWVYRNNVAEIIKVLPTNSIYYSHKICIESENNDGSFQDTITIRYAYPVGGILSGSNGENFVAFGKIIVNNLPAGLSMGIYRTSDTILIAVIEGNATVHNNVPDILNLGIEFQNTAFTHGNAGNVISSSTSDLRILFMEKIAVENATSTAGVNGIYKKTGYINGRRLYAKGEYRLGYRGCNAKWVIRGYDYDNTVLQGNGCPLYRTYEDGLLPYYNEGWVARNDQNEKITVLPVNSIQYSTTVLRENVLYNDGSINNDDVMALVYRYPFNNATFTGANGDDFLAQNKAVVMNLPAGLSMKLVRTNDTILVAEFSGKALLEDDVTNLTITLQNSAFSHNDTSSVMHYHRDDLTIDFVNIYTVASTGGDFSSLTSAINSPIVMDGDHLVMAAETFTEYNMTIGKDLVIRGQGPGKTIVQPTAVPGTVNGRIFYISNSNVTLENFTLRNATYSSNRGGGIYNYYSTLNIKNCDFYDNNNSYSSARGGAIYSYYGNLYIENCTFNNNRTSGTNTGNTYGGGAICIYHPGNIYKAGIMNSTFYDNYSHNNGGALLIFGNADIINTTIASDTAMNYGGGIYRYDYTINCLNIIIADNTSLISSGPDYYGPVTANYSIIENNTNTSINGSNNITGTDPELSPLADNGGLTRTCAIPGTSIAINEGIETALAPFDQRMAVRLDTTDIGAYEYNAVIPGIITTTTIGGPFIVPGNQPLALDVPYTVTGIFESNKFYAFLSGPDTNWAGERAVGELVSNTSGTIQTTIDTLRLLIGQSVYKIRVKSTSPAVTGTESNVFTITMVDQYIYPAADQIVNLSENGDTLRVYENPVADSRIWKYGTTSGVYPNNCGSTDTLYVPNFGTAGTYYVVCVSAYGTTDITSNEVRVEVVVPTILVDDVNTPPFHINSIVEDHGTVEYDAIGRYTGNVFTAFLSDRNGSFASENTIGNLVSDIDSIIDITIPTGLPSGTGYKIRIKSTSPVVTGVESDSFEIIFDTVPPSVVISSAIAGPVNDTVDVDIDFGELVRGFTVGDITTTNCTANDLSTMDSIVYTVRLAPDIHGTFTALVDSGVAWDKVGLANMRSNTFSMEYDTIKPTVEITSSESGSTDEYPFEIEITFSEDVTGFDISDLSVTNGDADNLQETTPQQEWTADIYASAQDEVRVRIGVNAVQDLAGNNLAAAATFTIDYTGEVAIPEKENINGISFYPNPCDGILYFTTGLTVNTFDITLSDITGKVVLRKNLNKMNDHIDLSGYSKGIYLMKIKYDDRVEYFKIILK